MKSIETLGNEYFLSVDETIRHAIVSIHTQISKGDTEELLRLCLSIQETEDDLYRMVKKLEELSGKLLEAGLFDRVVAYQEIAFKLETLIDKLIHFTEITKTNNININKKINALDSLDEELKKYIKTKNKYNF